MYELLEPRRSFMKLSKNTNIVGMKFNKLTVLEKIKTDKGIKYKCLCECGKETLVKCDKIKSGHTRSCGCLLTEHNKVAVTKMWAAKPPRESWKTSANRVLYSHYTLKNPSKTIDIDIDTFIELSNKDCSCCGAKPSSKFNWAIYDKKASQNAKDTRRLYL